MLALSGTGCIVDREYDWDKLDPEITVLKTGFTYPLGVNEKKTLGSLFNLENSSMIVVDEKGDYYLKVQPDPADVSVKISEDGDLTCSFKPVTYMLSQRSGPCPGLVPLGADPGVGKPDSGVFPVRRRFRHLLGCRRKAFLLLYRPAGRSWKEHGDRPG